MSTYNHAVIPSLDGIRAVSISLVFFAHAGVSSILPGGFGVTIFFFLSGFLITALFYRELEDSEEIDLRAFYLRRLLRLSPPLLITLSLVYGLVSVGVLEGVVRPEVILSQVLYYYNYYSIFSAEATEGALGLNVLWSLSVEEHFYLVFPFVFVFFSKSRRTLFAIVFILIFVTAWRIFRVSYLGATDYEIYVSTDTRFDSIMYGALLSVLVFERKDRPVFSHDAVIMWTYIFFAITVLLFSFLFRDPFFRSTLRYSVQGMALMPLFYYSVTFPRAWIFRPLNWKFMRIIGFYSYTIYLIHTVVLGNLHGLEIMPENIVLFSIFSFVVCIIYAAAVYTFAERPVKKMRKRFASQRFGQA